MNLFSLHDAFTLQFRIALSALSEHCINIRFMCHSTEEKSIVNASDWHLHSLKSTHMSVIGYIA